MKSFATCVLALAGALGVVACTGSANNGNPTPSGSGGGAGNGAAATADAGGGTASGGSETACRSDASLAPARISLITDIEYTNMIRDAFGVTFVPEVTAVKTGDYPLDESAQVASADIAKQYYRAADQVAGKLKPCGAAALGAGCMESFLRLKLPRVFKRPVTDAEIAGLMTIFNASLADGAQIALNAVMEAALVSGSFLYRTEVGADASGSSGSVAMSPYELANAVSFALLGTVPDDALWAKAADGTITQPAVLGAEVDRLLALQPARDLLTQKVSYYLNVEKIPVVSKDAQAFPEFTPSLQTSLYQSAQLFLKDLVWNGTFSDLFTSNKYYANAEIAKAYGLSPVQGSGLIEVQLPPERNAGILTHPGLLATSNMHTASDDIVHRGLWVYSNLVCGVSVGTPPPNADEIFKTLMGTDRVKAQARDALPQCGACHAFFDPFGMASENFDPIGRYRTIDPQDNMPVVSQSTIKNLGPDIDGDVSSMKDIADRLKTGRRVTDCATKLLAEYTLDHNPNEQNSCAIQQIKDNFATSGKFVDLFKAIVTSPAFATRDLASQ
jgi:Protein of unknown function (DUF1592)/Protein of unknown function (DUF1588)/Protein of unknown function (DUF1595)/Protein of unknown function (DUF1585)